MKKILVPFFITIIVIAFLMAMTACTVVYDAPIENVTIVDNASRYTLTEPVVQTGKKQLTASLAKNEYEGMQFILNFAYDVKNVHIDVSDIKNADGVLLALNGYYREHYLSAGGEEKYADALIPLCYPTSEFFDITANENQGIWLSVKAAKSQPAGIYNGSVRVTHDNGVINIPIEIEVWDFAIPTTPSTETSFELWFSTVWELMQKNNAVENADYYQTLQQYYWFLSNYRIVSPSIPEQYGNAEQFADLVEKYLADERINNYRIPMSKRPYDENGVLLPGYQAYIDELDSRGLLEKGFIYTYDEPSGSLYNEIVKSFVSVHNYNPKARQLLTSSPRKSLFGAVDIWCGILDTDVNSEWFVRDRQAAGDEVWWYGCITPQNPSPNYMLNQSLYAMRLLPWMQKDRNITGNLYWASAIQAHWTRDTGWSNPRDIWSDPITIYGPCDGTLIYAGTENDGVVNTNTPIPTIRLEAIRDGQEDYEYLVLMENKIQSILDKYGITDIDSDAVMDTFYSTLYNSMGNYNSNPSLMQETRKRLAHDIMADDSIIVAALPFIAESDQNMREIRVYAKTGLSVTIGGESVSGTDKGTYSVYSRVYSMQTTPCYTNVDIVVDGRSYTRTLVDIPEIDFRDFAYENVTAAVDALQLPIEPSVARAKCEENCFDFLSQTVDNRQVGMVVYNREDLPMLKQSIAKHSKNTIPLVIMNEETSAELQQKLSIYVPKGAKVMLNENAADFIEDGEKYSLYGSVVNFEEPGRHLVEIKVEYSGITEVFEEVVNQQTGKKNDVIDFLNQDVCKALDAINHVSVVEANGKKAAEITFDAVYPRGILFPVSAFNAQTTSTEGYTHIIFEITNNSNELINLPSIALACGLDFDVTPLYGLVRAGDTVTVAAKIPNGAKNRDINGIRFKLTDMLVTPTTITVHNIRFADMPYYYHGDSDYILLD